MQCVSALCIAVHNCRGASWSSSTRFGGEGPIRQRHSLQKGTWHIIHLPTQSAVPEFQNIGRALGRGGLIAPRVGAWRWGLRAGDGVIASAETGPPRTRLTHLARAHKRNERLMSSCAATSPARGGEP